MELLGLNILSGISYGMLLFFIASGLSLVFGMMGVLNLAHGAFYMLGAYLGIVATRAGGNWLLGLLVAGVSVGVLGFAVDRGLLRHLYKRLNEQVLLTLGLIYIFSNMVERVWTVPQQWVQPAPSILAGGWAIAGSIFPVYRLVLIGVGIIYFVGLWLLQEKTRIGAIIRAGMDDKEMLMGLGVNYGLISSAIFIFGSALGGLAGFLGTPLIGATPTMSLSIVMLAVVVIIVGGVGLVQGTLVGAMVIGIADALGKVYISFFAMFIPYMVMIIVLLVRPSGILGRARG